MSLIEKVDKRCFELRKKISLCQDSRYDTERTIYTNRLDECLRIKEIILSEQKEPCNYTLEDDDANTWECNKCGVEWVLEAGTPEDNEMNYCPKCGREIIG